jgi:hypothetical protein
MTMMEGNEKCSNPECDKDGICSVKGSNAKYCVICRPYEEAGPCDYSMAVKKKDGTKEERPCGSTDMVMFFITPGGVELERCREHRKSSYLLRESGLGY